MKLALNAMLSSRQARQNQARGTSKGNEDQDSCDTAGEKETGQETDHMNQRQLHFSGGKQTTAHSHGAVSPSVPKHRQT